MAQNPTSGGGPNQTLLELIYALRGLAETVEFYQKDLSQRLDDEAKVRTRELEQLRNSVSANARALHTLPITLSNRVEKLVEDLSTDMDLKFEDISKSISEVRQKLWQYMKVTERAISQTDSDGIPTHSERDDKAEITGRVELMEDGGVKVLLHSKIIRRIWHGILILAAGGGAYGLKEALQSILGG